MDGNTDSLDNIWLLLLFSAAAIAGLYFLFRHMVTKDLGIALRLDNYQYKPGDTIPVKICVAPKRDIKVNKVTASVYCVVGSHPHREGAMKMGSVVLSSGRSNDHRTSTFETCHYSEVTLCGSQTFQAGSEQVIEGKLQIDPSGHGTREASKLDRNWFLSVDVDIPQCPDVKLKEEIKVTPKYS